MDMAEGWGPTVGRGQLPRMGEVGQEGQRPGHGAPVARGVGMGWWLVDLGQPCLGTLLGDLTE